MQNKRLRNTKIIFVAAIVILMSLSLLSYIRINSLLNSSSILNHTNIVKLELESLFSRIKDADSDQRGYVLTKEEIYLLQFKKTLEDIKRKRQNLEQLTIDNYSQQQNLKRLNLLIDKRIHYMHSIIKDAPNMKITTERWLMARVIMNELRAQIDKMMNEEQFLLKMRTKTVLKQTAITPIFTIILTVCSILLVIAAYYAINSELKISKNLRNDLEDKNASLEKMNKELESFTYISSHDLQEPLRKIQIFISRIIEKENDNLSETGRSYIARTRQSAYRMQNLIRDLLAYSRLSVEIFSVANTKLDVIVNDVKDDLDEEIAVKNAVVEVHGDPNVKIIVSQFRQLLTNLISNSIKFADAERSPKITIKNETVKGSESGIDTIDADRLYSKITISDNGIGFDEQYKERIFKVFQRLHIDQQYIGTGIGLAIVKKIVDNHNGFISAHGETGKGATFIIYLPA